MKEEVVRPSITDANAVHFASLVDLCHKKPLDTVEALPDEKKKVVLWRTTVKYG